MKSFLITKDVLMKGYLPVYGNAFWHTPNIDELAQKGTVFYRHYTAAPSTAMAFTSMFTKKYAFQLGRSVYKHEEQYQGTTFFDLLTAKGIDSHIIWSYNYDKFALPFANCFRNASFHKLDMNQPVGPHINSLEPLKRDDDKAQKTLSSLFEIIDALPRENVFVWLHLPHVILGRTGYGDDIDLFDEIVGHIRPLYGDENIFISADHGNMNGAHQKYAYGFDVHDNAISIPLVTPRLEGFEKYNRVTTNKDISNIILNRAIPRRDYVISETAYALQPKKKIAIVTDRYKLIYDKWYRAFSLYDTLWDKAEENNLLACTNMDIDRHRLSNTKELYFYPYWDEAEIAYTEMMHFFNDVWTEGTKRQELRAKIKYYLIQAYAAVRRMLNADKTNGKQYRK